MAVLYVLKLLDKHQVARAMCIWRGSEKSTGLQDSYCFFVSVITHLNLTWRCKQSFRIRKRSVRFFH